jgi:glycosyltransferase involved in cell wall biosynthesis
MKIVLGVHHYPPTFVGGVELLAERIARSLVVRGHSVEVICVEDVSTETSFTVRTDLENGVTVHRLGLRLAEGRDPIGLRFKDPRIEAWCTQYFARTQPDVFHSLSSYVLTASAIEAAIELGIPTVAGLEDYWYFCPRMTLLRTDGQRCSDSAQPKDCAWCLMGESRRYRMLPAQSTVRRLMVDRGLALRIDERQHYLDRVLDQVDVILTPAPFIRDLLTSRRHLAHKVRLLEHGLDTHSLAARHGRRGDKLRLGYLGQIIPAKGVHVLIEAFKSLREAGDSIELQIHGDMTRFPAYAARLRRLAGGDPRIQFHGPYASTDLGRVLAGIDALVFPSGWFETLGIVILEAFQAGIPVIASRLPNHMYQIRDEVDGLLFEADQPDDLVRQLRRLLAEPTLLSELASHIRPVRTFETEMSELADVYSSVHTRQPRQPVLAGEIGARP